MKDWRERLAKAISDKGRSLRDVSLKAGLSPGYLHTVIYNNIEPGLSRVVRVADELGVSPIEIIFGFEITSEAEDLLRSYSKLPPAQRDALRVLARLKKAIRALCQQPDTRIAREEQAQEGASFLVQSLFFVL